jgi:hypothetical protein
VPFFITIITLQMSKYDLVRSHIDFVRQNLRETSDDSHFTDEQIYMALLEARGLIMERRLEKNKQFPEELYQTICLELCLDQYVDCGECLPIPDGCYVLKTVAEIPSGMFDGQSEILRVSTLMGKEIAPLTEDKHRLREYRKTGKNNYYYIRMNNKLAIFNVPQNRLKAIKIKGIFEDPAGAELASACAGTDSCTTVLDASFGTKVADRMAIREEVFKILLRTDKQPEDRSNNAGSEPPQQVI